VTSNLVLVVQLRWCFGKKKFKIKIKELPIPIISKALKQLRIFGKERALL
jgi:hypothetical protein